MHFLVPNYKRWIDNLTYLFETYLKELQLVLENDLQTTVFRAETILTAILLSLVYARKAAL